MLTKSVGVKQSLFLGPVGNVIHDNYMIPGISASMLLQDQLWYVAIYYANFVAAIFNIGAIEVTVTDVLKSIQIVVMAILTAFLVLANWELKELNKMNHRAELQISRFRPVDDNGLDRIEVLLSNSGGGAIKNIKARFHTPNLIVHEENEGTENQEKKLVRKDFNAIESGNYQPQPNTIDVNRVLTDEDDINSQIEKNGSKGHWLPTVGNTLQGKETDILFDSIVNLNLGPDNDKANFSDALDELSNQEVSNGKLKGIEFEIEFLYDCELEDSDRVKVLEYVIPVKKGMTLNESVDRGLEKEKFDSMPSRLITRSRI